jgi:putative peptidoglycan lipid II flippase
MFNFIKKIQNLIKFNSIQALAITGLSLVLSALGFLGSLLLARVFGLGADIDAFLYATSIPLFIAAIIAGYFMYGTIPLLMQTDDQVRTSSEILLFACLLSCPFFLMSILFKVDSIYNSPSLFGIYGVNLNLEFVAWIIGGVQVIFSALTAILNAKKYFLMPIFLQILTPLGSIFGALITLVNPNIIFPLVGMLIGVVSATIISFIVLRSLLIGIRKSSLIKVISLFRYNKDMLCTLLASSAFGVYAVIDAKLAISFGEGALSTLGYAQRIVIGFGNIAVIGIFATSGPKLSDALLNVGFGHFLKVLKKSIINVVCIAVIVGLLLIYNLNLLLNFIFGSNVNSDEVLSLRSILPFMLIGMVPMLCSSILLRAVLCIKGLNFYILLFGAGVPVVYIIFCFIFSPIGLLSFGVSYLISWFFGFLILSIPLYLKRNQV